MSSVRQWLRDGVQVLFTQGPKAFARGVQRVLRRELAARNGEATAAAAAMQAPAQWPMLCWHLESPDPTQPPADPARLDVRGWIAAVGDIEYVRFADARVARALDITLAPRPDVTAAYGMAATGFSASAPYEAVSQPATLALEFAVAGRKHEIVVPAYRPPTDVAALKRAKLERLRGVLQCPSCGSRTLDESPASLQCRHCSAVFPRSETALDFLTPELRAAFDIVPTDNVSSNSYDGEALNIIHRLRDGLVLDCGAGLRDRYFGNVVNYEIVPYATTDVLGVGERLPFADAAFDAVFSFAVLEHVKDPFACSRELLRVLKPGGTLYCQVPFLQPVHGYPHHYYNMTATGMRNLFGDAIEVERMGTFLFGQPVFALSWILNRYAQGLPPGAREEFTAMKVGDLLEPGNKYLAAPFVTALAEATREELSCCNGLIARKR